MKNSIIIPVFNKWELTRACLKSIQNNGLGEDSELLVVDNASTDSTLDAIAREFPGVRHLRQEINLGFGKACNLGAREARGEFLLFLNNDTLVEPGWLDALLELMASQPKAGIIGAKLLYPNRRIQHAGIAFNEDKEPFHIYIGFNEDSPCVNKVRRYQAVTGACILIPRSLFLDEGGFDEHYNNGHEDIDLCLRVKQAGFEIWYQPKSCIIHFESQTLKLEIKSSLNRKFFCNRWRGKIRSDEMDYYLEDGFSSEIFPVLHRYTKSRGSPKFIPSSWQISPDTSSEILKTLKFLKEELRPLGVDLHLKKVEQHYCGAIGTMDGTALHIKTYLRETMAEPAKNPEGIYEIWCLKPQEYGDIIGDTQLAVYNSDGKKLRDYAKNLPFTFKFLAASMDLPGSSTQGLLSRGRLFLSEKDYETAGTLASNIMDLFPNDVEPYMLMGDVKWATGKFEDAKIFYEIALKMAPGYSYLTIRLAKILIRKGRLEKARHHLKQLLKQKPFYLQAQLLLWEIGLKKLLFMERKGNY